MKKSNLVGMAALGIVPFLFGCADVQVAEPPRAAVPPPPPQPPVVEVAPQAPALSPNSAEVAKLAQAGSSTDVIMAYIQGSPTPFNLNADQILYLKDLGVSSDIVTAMINRDTELRNQPPPVVQAPPTPVTPPLTPPAEPPPVYVSTPPPDVAYFYNDLSPYGAWIQVEGIGWCWQPHVVVVNRAWRPYCDAGHWVYTDAGWFWQSDYSWGWAPFHYGRWQLHPACGWVWLPDRVWGPAWVVWRGQGDYCGWAPLPPHADFDAHSGWRYNGVHVGVTFDFGLHADHFTFIAMRDFHDHDYAHRSLPPTEVTKVYNNTTIINNYTVVNNTVVNNGVQVDRVQAATHTEFKRVPIRDVPAGTRVQSDQKSDSAAYRHEVKAPARPVKMVAQKVDPQHPVVAHATAAPQPQAGKASPAESRSDAAAPNRRPQAEPIAQQPVATGSSGRHYPAPKATPPASTPPNASRPAERPKPVETAKPAPAHAPSPVIVAERSEPSQNRPQSPSATTNQKDKGRPLTSPKNAPHAGAKGAPAASHQPEHPEQPAKGQGRRNEQ